MLGEASAGQTMADNYMKCSSLWDHCQEYRGIARPVPGCSPVCSEVAPLPVPGPADDATPIAILVVHSQTGYHHPACRPRAP